VLLTRTSPADSRHRGITVFFVDMDTPGITVRPIEIISGGQEFCEVFFDDVEVPAHRMVGELNGGWSLAMGLLPYERSSAFWHCIAFLRNRMQPLVCEVEQDRHAEAVIGDAFATLYALRSRSGRSQHRLGAGDQLGADTSIHKQHVASAEQQLFNAA